jgi:hypothetical protein
VDFGNSTFAIGEIRGEIRQLAKIGISDKILPLCIKHNSAINKVLLSRLGKFNTCMDKGRLRNYFLSNINILFNAINMMVYL